MDTVLLLIMAGLCAIPSHAARQYHFIYELKTMPEAQSYCRQRYTDLATIENMEDANTLDSMADRSKIQSLSSGDYYAWIGLYEDQAMDGWKWSLSDTSFYQQGEMEFRQWLNGQPAGWERCAYTRDDGQWYDAGCQEQYKAVCLDIASSVTFVFINTTMTWTDAQSYCRQQYTDLASVRNITDNQKVQQLIPSGENVWIGLFKDSWKWSDGSNSSFRHWRNSEPSGSATCVAADFAANYGGRWTNIACSMQRMCICYGNGEFYSMTQTLKEKLKDHGLNDDIKLKWKKQPDGKVFHKTR
ncbi:C-type mannose receptor 2-like [Epinephelus moara]|uniref:C-type mannose receptor 2-like n=1 Tax=Epinephelus moara TaxID=300413 RepID=UPI00214E48C4|nr:C-type mannose receptor 2-like [Epinephelus moara]